MPSESEMAFLNGLLAEVPEFRRIYEDNVEFNGEVLPMVIMDEFSRFILEEFRKARAAPSAPSDKLVRRALAYLESALADGDEAVSTLIRTTFAESVEAEWRDQEFFQALLNRLGPRLRQTVSVSP